MIDVKKTFEKFNHEYLYFKDIELPLNKRPDICAFLILDKLVGGSCDIVGSSVHDEIYLSIDVDELSKTATEIDILNLVRCGVRYHEEFECLAMFV